jgi:hypothetical protein
MRQLTCGGLGVQVIIHFFHPSIKPNLDYVNLNFVKVVVAFPAPATTLRKE